jgi:hypothetical protein
MSQTYTELTAMRVLDGIQQMARQMDHLRFLEVNATTDCSPVDAPPATPTTYVDASRDEALWREVLDGVATAFEGKSQMSYTMAAGTDNYQRVSRLVPWSELTVQAYKNPQARRLPTAFPFLHRGCALMLNDGTITTETESIANISANLSTRFQRPVRNGVFFFGYAPDNPTNIPPPDRDDIDAPPIRPNGSLGTDEIWFEGVTEHNCPKALRSAVARMHTNGGHPTRQEFLRGLVALVQITPHLQPAAP